MTARTATNGSLNDRMAKMRAAKAAKMRPSEPPAEARKPPRMPIGYTVQSGQQQPPLKITLPQQYEQPPVMKGVLDVQIGTDPDMQNVTLIVKGPAPKMRALVRFAIEQSVPFLNEDAS